MVFPWFHWVKKKRKEVVKKQGLVKARIGGSRGMADNITCPLSVADNIFNSSQ